MGSQRQQLHQHVKLSHCCCRSILSEAGHYRSFHLDGPLDPLTYLMLPPWCALVAAGIRPISFCIPCLVFPSL